MSGAPASITVSRTRFIWRGMGFSPARTGPSLAWERYICTRCGDSIKTPSTHLEVELAPHAASCERRDQMHLVEAEGA